MRRWFIILLVLLMPLRSVWAVCACEGVGEHVGVPAEVLAIDAAQEDADGCNDQGHASDNSAPDCNPLCTMCHLGLAQLLPSAASPLMSTSTPPPMPLAQHWHPSPIPDGIERPQWPHRLIR